MLEDMRQYHTVYLALGSNLGDRLHNLQNALLGLPEQITLLDTSPVFETPPWGYSEQPPFLNMVARVKTTFSPRKLLNELKAIERDLGRQPTIQYGPRLIDLDILFYDDNIIDLPGLIIPHPRITERAFVLVPLASLAPDLIHPILKVSVTQMLNSVDTSGITLYKSVVYDNFSLNIR